MEDSGIDNRLTSTNDGSSVSSSSSSIIMAIQQKAKRTYSKTTSTGAGSRSIDGKPTAMSPAIGGGSSSSSSIATYGPEPGHVQCHVLPSTPTRTMAAASSSSRRISGNPAATKRQFGIAPRSMRKVHATPSNNRRQSQNSHPAGASSSSSSSKLESESPHDATAADAVTAKVASAAAIAKENGPATNGSPSRCHPRPSLISWAKNIAEPNENRNNSLFDDDDHSCLSGTSGISVRRSATSQSRSSASAKSTTTSTGGRTSVSDASLQSNGSDGMTPLPYAKEMSSRGMDMRQAALQASQFLANLPKEERGSFVLPGDLMEDTDGHSTTADNDSGFQQYQQLHVHAHGRRQSRFSNAVQLDNINEEGDSNGVENGNKDKKLHMQHARGSITAGRKSIRSILPLSDEELRRTSDDMQDLFSDLELDDDDSVKQVRGNGTVVAQRPSLARENTEKHLNTGSGRDDQETTKGNTEANPSSINVVFPPKPDQQLSRNLTATASNKSSNRMHGPACTNTKLPNNMTDIFRLPLTLAAPPPPSPLTAIVGIARQSATGALLANGLVDGIDTEDYNYATLPEGIARVTSHTLSATQTYLSRHFPNAELSVRDLVSTPDAWKIHLRLGSMSKEQIISAGEDGEIPTFLRSSGYRFGYERRCDVMVRPGSTSTQLWYENVTAMSSFSLLYCSKHPLAIGPDDSDSAFQEDLLLYGFVAEHRAHVPHFTHFGTAVREEISSLTQVGIEDIGSAKNSEESDNVDDSLAKLITDGGAEIFLAPLVDDRNERKFCLAITSGVTGNMYTYGEASEEPRAPTRVGGGAIIPSRRLPIVNVKPGSLPGLGVEGATNFYGLGRGITRISLLLKDDGSIAPDATTCNGISSSDHTPTSSSSSRESLDPSTDLHLALMADFRLLNADSSSKSNDDFVGYGTASKHALLLDPREAGRIYVDGQLVLSLCDDESSTPLSPSCSLFGYDLVNIPTSRSKNGLRITDFDAMKRAVGTLIQECLVDASQGHKQIGGKLLNRLIHGEDRSMALVAGGDGTNGSAAAQSLSTPTLIVGTCLESEVMSNKKYDPVGISCKALATRFSIMYGKQGFPTLACDERYVKERLGPHRRPIVVPQRALNVLRRGGLLDMATMEEKVWFSNVDAIYDIDKLSDASNANLVERALRHVNDAMVKAEVETIDASDILFVPSSHLYDGLKPVHDHSYICRCNPNDGLFYLNDAVFDFFASDKLDEQGKIRLLGLYFVQQHPKATEILPYYVVAI